jgi:hypothetical protein
VGALIASGRVAVNGKQVLEKGGFKVVSHRDVIALDGTVIEGWEDMNTFDNIISGGRTNPPPPSSPQQMATKHKNGNYLPVDDY